MMMSSFGSQWMFVPLMLALASSASAKLVCDKTSDGGEHCESANEWSPYSIASIAIACVSAVILAIMGVRWLLKRRKQQHNPNVRQFNIDPSQVQGASPMNATMAVRGSLDMAERAQYHGLTFVSVPPKGHTHYGPRTAEPSSTFNAPLTSSASATRSAGPTTTSFGLARPLFDYERDVTSAGLQSKYPFDGYSNTRPPPPPIGAKEMV